MKKEEILKAIKELKEMLEMDAEEWAKIYGKKFGDKINGRDVYPYRTGVAISELNYILEQSHYKRRYDNEHKRKR